MRLRKLWDEKQMEWKSRGQRLTQAIAADHFGWSEQSAVSQYLNGRIPLNLDAVFKFSKLLEVEASEIWPSLGRLMESQTPAYNLDKEARAIPHKVPLISWVQAGAWTEIIDNFEPGDADEWVDAPFNVSENSFALTVHGDSMQPEFAEGDVIIVDPQRRPENGSYVVARLDDEAESTFKQLQIDGGRKYLKPLNPRYPVLQVNGDMTICGVVRAKTKLY